MKKFEYKFVMISIAHLSKKSFRLELDEAFQKWGNDGWELVKMEPIPSDHIMFRDSKTDEFFTVFKREKAE
ncbi:DUF4177 domain-containing protein [Limibacter armeniacum]|uniref:DUF4177 domain-containing protein n=1 Tax=Limibacter armeniacum TaxID=466084 RepID=UPI002FE6BB98